MCDELIQDRLVIGIKSHEVRKRLLREKALTLNTNLDIIRAAETASDQLKKIDGEVETSVHAVRYRGKKPAVPDEFRKTQTKVITKADRSEGQSKTRGNASIQTRTGSSFESGWLRTWREFCGPIKEQSQAKPK